MADPRVIDLARDIPWTSLPTDLILAELARRQDAQPEPTPAKPVCGSKGRGSYDTTLHVFALVLILALSTLACGFPLAGRRASKGSRAKNIIFYCQHFGTGVLIATAFVHLLPTAFISLTDPCLPDFFNKGYEPLAGLIGMISVLVVVSIESYLSTRGAGHSHSHGHSWEDTDEDEDGTATHIAHANGGLSTKRGSVHRPPHIALEDLGDREGLMAGVSPLPESTPTGPAKSSGKPGYSRARDDDDFDDEADLVFDMDELEPPPTEDSRPLAGSSSGPAIRTPRSDGLPSSAEEQKKMLLQCLMLEAGILFHSVFIGMALSVATGPPFIIFLVAIGFHQTFEGLALGSRIAAINFPKSSPRPWLMVLAYGVTTPIGQAIGLGVHELYDPMSQTGLLMVGIMNAISSGLLLFAGLVQLLSEDFLSEKSYKILKGKRRRDAFLCVVGGAALMAIVGAFA